jgi:ADP-ribosylglycohydrolase
MATNQHILDHLFETGQIDLRRGGLFDLAPGPMPEDFDYGRVEGMLLGLAAGDALGCTTESQSPGERRARYGEVRDYLPNRYAGGQPVGLPSDDTQLAFWTLEQMLADGGFNPEHVAARFCRGRIFGIGSTVQAFIRCYTSGTKRWYECGQRSAGNGALMRIAPMLIPHLRTGTADVWADTALSAMLTHNDSGSTAACLAFTHMLWQLLAMDTPPEPAWWLETYVAAAGDLETDDTYRPRGGAFTGYRGTIWRFVRERVGEAHRRDLPVLAACDAWHSGAYLLETVPSVLYILMRHSHDPEEAMVRAVNDTRDNDTIAAIAGAAVGALHGRAGLPERWISQLAGRTAEHDDGRIFDLLEQSKRKWWLERGQRRG